jgi:hypothetical protein
VIRTKGYFVVELKNQVVSFTAPAMPEGKQYGLRIGLIGSPPQPGIQVVAPSPRPR